MKDYDDKTYNTRDASGKLKRTYLQQSNQTINDVWNLGKDIILFILTFGIVILIFKVRLWLGRRGSWRILIRREWETLLLVISSTQ